MAIDLITSAAQSLRQTHDRAGLKSYIDATFQPYDQVPASTFIKAENYLRDLPVDLDERIKALAVRVGYSEARALRDKQRYEQIRTEGLDALNSREIMHNGSGEPRLAINAQMMVLHSHIMSDKVLLPKYRQLLDTWRSERISAGHQIDLF